MDQAEIGSAAQKATDAVAAKLEDGARKSNQMRCCKLEAVAQKATDAVALQNWNGRAQRTDAVAAKLKWVGKVMRDGSDPLWVFFFFL